MLKICDALDTWMACLWCYSLGGTGELRGWRNGNYIFL